MVELVQIISKVQNYFILANLHKWVACGNMTHGV